MPATQDTVASIATALVERAMLMWNSLADDMLPKRSAKGARHEALLLFLFGNQLAVAERIREPNVQQQVQDALRTEIAKKGAAFAKLVQVSNYEYSAVGFAAAHGPEPFLVAIGRRFGRMCEEPTEEVTEIGGKLLGAYLLTTGEWLEGMGIGSDTQAEEEQVDPAIRWLETATLGGRLALMTVLLANGQKLVLPSGFGRPEQDVRDELVFLLATIVDAVNQKVQSPKESHEKIWHDFVDHLTRLASDGKPLLAEMFASIVNGRMQEYAHAGREGGPTAIGEAWASRCGADSTVAGDWVVRVMDAHARAVKEEIEKP